MNKDEILKLVPSIGAEDAELLALFFDEELEKLLPDTEAIRAEAFREAEEKARVQRQNEEMSAKIAQAAEALGAKNSKAVMPLLKLDEISEEEGGLCGLSEQIEALKKEFPFMFSFGGEKPRFTNGDIKSQPGYDKSKLTYKEMLKLYRETPELYKQLVK